MSALARTWVIMRMTRASAWVGGSAAGGGAAGQLGGLEVARCHGRSWQRPAGTLGSGDMQRLRMEVFSGTPERRAMTEEQRVVRLPMTIELQRFILETYDDGSPRRYASEIIVQRDGEAPLHLTTDVNRPAEAYGWKIYQYGYDARFVASDRQTSVLELVRDPWLPAVYTGIYMMLAGAVLLLFGLQSKASERL